MQVGATGGATAAIFGNWARTFASNGWTPTTTLFDYLMDEPGTNCSAWSSLIANGNTRHAFNSPALHARTSYSHLHASGWLWWDERLKRSRHSRCQHQALEPPGGPLENLQNYHNWVAGPNPAGVQRQFWAYQACDSTGTCGNQTIGNSLWTFPNVNIDGKPAANRAMEWMTFLHGQTGELYYDPAYCAEPTQITHCGSPQSNDPWKNNYAFGGWGR